MIGSMFQIQLPVLEKILRPVIVYLALVLFLRLFGKRELAQLNPFDLVVLLSLSNTVQNAMIGNDNSVSGGILGAFSLLTVNWLLTRIIYRAPWLNTTLQGGSRTLIMDGAVDHAALRKEALTEQELLSVLHRQSFDTIDDVRSCTLEPNGTFYIEPRKPTREEKLIAELVTAVQKLSDEVQSLKSQAGPRT